MVVASGLALGLGCGSWSAARAFAADPILDSAGYVSLVLESQEYKDMDGRASAFAVLLKGDAESICSNVAGTRDLMSWSHTVGRQFGALSASCGSSTLPASVFSDLRGAADSLIDVDACGGAGKLVGAGIVTQGLHELKRRKALEKAKALAALALDRCQRIGNQSRSCIMQGKAGGIYKILRRYRTGENNDQVDAGFSGAVLSEEARRGVTSGVASRQLKPLLDEAIASAGGGGPAAGAQ